MEFQSTPPRRGDRRAGGWRRELHGFNPRPREGATALDFAMLLAPDVSIHAPAKGRLAAAGVTAAE